MSLVDKELYEEGRVAKTGKEVSLVGSSGKNWQRAESGCQKRVEWQKLAKR